MSITTTLPRAVDLYAALPQSDWIDGFNLNVAATAERVAIPLSAAGAKARFVLFSCTDNFAAKLGTGSVTAAMPSDTTDGTGSMLNPTFMRILDAQTHISCVSDTAGAKVSLSYFLEIPTAAA